jgi:hypothetical protein
MKAVVQENIDILQEELQKVYGKQCRVIITQERPACEFWVGRYYPDGNPLYYIKEPKDLLSFIEGLISEGKIAEGTLTHHGKIFFYNASGERVR